jgi:hypothetical protein
MTVGLIIASSPVVTESYADEFTIGFEHHSQRRRAAQ